MYNKEILNKLVRVDIYLGFILLLLGTYQPINHNIITTYYSRYYLFAIPKILTRILINTYESAKYLKGFKIMFVEHSFAHRPIKEWTAHITSQ